MSAHVLFQIFPTHITQFSYGDRDPVVLDELLVNQGTVSSYSAVLSETFSTFCCSSVLYCRYRYVTNTNNAHNSPATRPRKQDSGK
jgi:hypothetical protein